MRAIATWCIQHRKTTLIVWLIAIIALVGIEKSAGSNYQNSFSLKGTQSFDALNLLKKAAPEASGDSEVIVFSVTSGKVTDAGSKTRINAELQRLSKLSIVSSVASPFSTSASGQISSDGTVAFAKVTMTKLASDYTDTQAKHFVAAVNAGSGQGLTVADDGQVGEASENTGGGGAAFGALAALIVLLFVLGSFLGAILPLITAGFALGVGISVIGLLSNVITMASFSSDLALLIGLGVGVDYALFIVTRHRQGLMRGKSVEEAIVDALDTSGRAVMFAGITVCIALLGMFALGVSFLYGVAIAAAIVVTFTVFSALTLLPALLALFGPRLLSRRARRRLAAGEFASSDGGRFWTSWAERVRRHPIPMALLGVVIMGLIAIPFFSLRLGSSDAGSDPSGSTTRVAYDVLARGFGPGYNGPLQLVSKVDSPAQKQAFVKVLAEAKTTPGVKSVTPIVALASSGASSVLTADVYPTGSPQAKSTTTLLNNLRDTVVPRATQGTGAKILIGGQTAIFADFASVLSSKLPLFIGIVVLLSCLLLAAVFRSLVVPITAAAMNMLSAGAAFGVVVAVFQWGWADSILGINQTGPVEAFVPVMMFAILFGLSMDYEVFLVSRIFEEWHRRRDNAQAVSHGLSATGKTISAAATIMVLVFGSFIFGGTVVIKMFGLGLAGAVLMDAFVVRMLLVPALMTLLGRSNWWLPRFLDRTLPRLNVEGSVDHGDGPAVSLQPMPEAAGLA
jgi:RND superfamily putative drug exporter